MPTIPTGIRNNNYLNVKNGSDPWMDASGRPSRTDSRGHAMFSDPAWGVRAGILLLRTYFLRHRLRTIAEILARWAPASDTIGSLPGAPVNSPADYSRFVEGRLGIDHSRRLELFREDGTILNLGQLKDLFFAMAAYEIGGGFVVPAAHFRAGAELVEPGITGRAGTEGHATEELLVERAITSENSPWRIGGSVGSWKKGALNAEEDVLTLQRMLRNAAMVLENPLVDPGAEDGKISRREETSNTIRAIRQFQRRFFANPDGLVAVGGRTWRELVYVLEHGPGDEGAPDPAGDMLGSEASVFPFASLPAVNWTSAPRSFGASRNGGARAHAGCDLYFPAGTTIHAIKAGRVVRGPYAFYAGTYALEIDHGDFIARYGEVAADTLVHQGDEVQAGQPIAKVGRLVGINVPSNMLHLEIYDKSSTGPLTVPVDRSARTTGGVPYLRRRDLQDPTPLLNELRGSLAPNGAARSAALAARAAAERPAPVGTGFTIRVVRFREDRRQDWTPRTVGTYECLWNGRPIPELSGQMIETHGPGDNGLSGVNNARRIAPGTYRLGIHYGERYRTYGYGQPPHQNTLPGLYVHDTGSRSAILIHPGVGFKSSVGCLNPTSILSNARSDMRLADSRRRTTAIIDALTELMEQRFPTTGVIPDATLVVSERFRP